MTSDFRDSLLAAMRSATVCAVPAAGLVVVALRGLRPALIAANKLLHVASPHWSDALMPSTLFAFLGLVYGGGLAWRLSAGAGVGEPLAWLVGGAGILLVVVVGAAAAPMIFAAGIPTTCWLSLTATAVTAGAALYLVTKWLG